jgi:hypothetical protein
MVLYSGDAHTGAGANDFEMVSEEEKDGVIEGHFKKAHAIIIVIGFRFCLIYSRSLYNPSLSFDSAGEVGMICVRSVLFILDSPGPRLSS